jgi:hypothetical protein
MGLRRRQSAGARMGRLACSQGRNEAERPGRPPIPRTDFPKTSPQFYLVGEPQRHRGPQRLSRRLSRSRQHRRLRPQRAAAHRRSYRTVRRHQLDGHVLPKKFTSFSATITKSNVPPAQAGGSISGRSPAISPSGSRVYFCATKRAADRSSAPRKSFTPTPTGAISFPFMNTSTATTAPVSAPATRPAGPR